LKTAGLRGGAKHHTDYNQEVRKAFFLTPLLMLAACNPGNPSKEAIRQGLLDHLKGSSVNLAAMDMDVTAVEFDGGHANVTVAFKPKGAPTAQGMALHYRMEEKSGRWAVVGVQDTGHSGTVAQGTANPHHGGAAPNPPSGAMPSPDDLPPTRK
jgi:hypothetical protein